MNEAYQDILICECSVTTRVHWLLIQALGLLVLLVSDHKSPKKRLSLDVTLQPLKLKKTICYVLRSLMREIFEIQNDIIEFSLLFEMQGILEDQQIQQKQQVAPWLLKGFCYNPMHVCLEVILQNAMGLFVTQISM